MAVYRSDPELFFLKECANEDLKLLVDILTTDPKDKCTRYTETLTSDSEYKKYYPNHKAYWQSIAAELQTYGGSTIGNILRGNQGVPYREILTDVCDKMKVNYNKNAAIELIEMNLLLKMLEESMEKMSEDELNQFVRNMGIELTNPTPELVIMALQTSIKLSGFAAYQLATTVLASILKILGITASFGTYILLSQAIKVISGPIGWAVSSAWLVSDIAGPAYRVTIPSCIIIAYMRQKHLYEKKQKENGAIQT
ncbi:oxidoreductase [Gilliamella sp. App2-1]|uniref:DUF3944 domain-containing protein n=1 Tax=Gilliamella sp. App2-1 TaxID=3120230 RepID=UPI000828164C|nr:DUF3944 domain-containing protein [Gilliamella apicola]OCG23705.1 oxidoreductase [Gilliamella apicola]